MPNARITQSGTIELPAELRQRFGLLEGDEIIVEEREDGILLRPAVVHELWTPEEKAGYLLNNSITQEDYDQACEDVREMGLDPAKVPFTDPDMRSKLLTGAEFDARMDALDERAKGQRAKEPQTKTA